MDIKAVRRFKWERRRKRKAREPSGFKMKKQTAWMKHLMKVKKENPKKPLGECMKIAKKSYKK